jgi:hypothetical protein
LNIFIAAIGISKTSRVDVLSASAELNFLVASEKDSLTIHDDDNGDGRHNEDNGPINERSEFMRVKSRASASVSNRFP